MAYKVEDIEKRLTQKYDKNLTYDLSNYVNQESIISITCSKHGEFKCKVRYLLRNSSYNTGTCCPKCHNDNIKETTTNKWLEHFLKKSHNRHGKNKFSYPRLAEEYKNKLSLITIVCNTCNNTFKTVASYHYNVKYGGCDVCKNKKITYEYLLENLKFIDVTLIPFEDRKSGMDKVILSCPKHGEYKVNIKSLLKHIEEDGICKCIECSKGRYKPYEGYKDTIIEKLKDSGVSIVFPNEYKGLKTKINFQCNTCKHEFTRTINYTVSKDYDVFCPQCSSLNQALKKRKTTEEFIEEAISIHGDELYGYEEVEYEKSDKKIRVFCKRCNDYFSIEANSHLQGNGCPNHYRKRSKVEEEIIALLNEKFNIPLENIESNKRFYNNRIRSYELDIYIVSLNVGIEYNGVYWHSVQKKGKGYHSRKLDFFERQNIRVFNIFESEYIHNQEYIISKLEEFLYNKTEYKIGECYDRRYHSILDIPSSYTITKLPPSKHYFDFDKEVSTQTEYYYDDCGYFGLE